jgi:hypothetical protein
MPNANVTWQVVTQPSVQMFWLTNEDNRPADHSFILIDIKDNEGITDDTAAVIQLQALFMLWNCAVFPSTQWWIIILKIWQLREHSQSFPPYLEDLYSLEKNGFFGQFIS